MASKEYQVIFQFKAALDSSMGSIKNITDELATLKDRAAELQALLADARNMKAYEQSVKDATARLEEMKAAERDAAAALEQATQARRNAEQEVDSHNLRIKELNAQIENEKQAHKSNMDMLKAAKASEAEKAEETMRHRIAMEELTKKLGEEKVALERSKQALSQAKREEQDAKRQKESATAATVAAQRALDAEQKKLEEVSAALKAAGVDTSELDKYIQKLTTDLQATNKQFEEMQKQKDLADQYAAGFKKAADNLRAMSMALSLMESAAKPVWDFLAGSLEDAAALEKQISAVKAISGASLEETAQITEVIRRTGRSTVYTAEEAAQAMQNMALAGWDAQQMIAGLPAVVNLAAAAGEELANMTSIVADGMNAFQLSGEKAAIYFSDVLAKAATSSNTNVALIGDSLSYVETTAGNLGYKIEDVSIALAAMANNALKGSVAGTALNTMLTRVSGANQTAANEMEALGLSMYDSNHQAKPLLQFLNELRGAFQNFGDDAQAAQISAYRLAGMRGMRGLLALVNQSDEQWNKLTQAIYNYQGAADQISTTRLENYSGKLQLLNDAWTDLKITIGNQILPVATEGIEALTELTDRANDLLATSKPLALWAAGTSGAIIGMSKAVGVASSAAQGLYYIMRMIPGLTPGMMFGGLGIAAGAAALTGLIFAISQSDYVQSMKAGTRYLEEVNELSEKNAGIKDRSREKLAAAVTTSEKGAALNEIDDDYADQIALWESELEKARNKKAAFEKEMGSRGHYYVTPDETLETGMVNTATVAEIKSLADYDTAIGSIMLRIAGLKLQRENYHKQMIEDVQEELGIQHITIEQYQKLEEKVSDLAAAWSEVWQKTNEAYSSVFGLFDKVEPAEAKLSEMMEGLESQSKYWEEYAQNLETLKTVSKDAGIDLGNLWDLIGQTGDTQSAAYLQEIINSLGDLENPDTTELQKLIQLYNDATAAKQAAVDVFTSESQEVQQAVTEFSDELQQIIEDTEAYGEAKTAMEKTLDGFIDGLDSKDNAVLEAADRFRTSLQTKLSATITPTFTYTPTFGFTGYSGLHSAGGTGNAMPGAYLVGERGPEMVLMGGGERVLSAGQTKRLLSMASGAGAGSFVVNVNVAGSASAQTVADLRAYGNELEAMFKRLLRNERVNAQRRAYT